MSIFRCPNKTLEQVWSVEELLLPNARFSTKSQANKLGRKQFFNYVNLESRRTINQLCCAASIKRSRKEREETNSFQFQFQIGKLTKYILASSEDHFQSCFHLSLCLKSQSSSSFKILRHSSKVLNVCFSSCSKFKKVASQLLCFLHSFK